MRTSTLHAFIARGIDYNKAQQLVSAGYTMNSLKKLNLNQLKQLHLSESIINIIQNESRPPIPIDIVTKLLYESKRTCCVCRDSSKSIIIHHIDEWRISKNHSENNLVVLCLQHHDEAHSKKTLSLNLSKEQLLNFKERWTTFVLHQDARVILDLMLPHSRWDYVNIQRVFELFLDLNIDYENIQSFPVLLSLNIVDARGIPRPKSNWEIKAQSSYHLCDFGEGIYYMHYLKAIINQIVEKLPIIDLTNNLSISFIKSMVKPGSIITAQLGYYFSDIDKVEYAGKQLRKAYYRGNSLKIEFSFDACECTSTSGRFDALTGHKIAVPILFVRSILEDPDKNIIISGSCLAIGTWFENHRQLENIPNRSNFQDYDDFNF